MQKNHTYSCKSIYIPFLVHCVSQFFNINLLWVQHTQCLVFVKTVVCTCRLLITHHSAFYSWRCRGKHEIIIKNFVMINYFIYSASTWIYKCDCTYYEQNIYENLHFVPIYCKQFADCEIFLLYTTTKNNMFLQPLSEYKF